MVAESPDIFADQQQFEAYYQSVMDRLEAEYRERVAFLTEGLGRLRNLQRMAEALHDEEMQRDLEARANTAQAELQALESALTEGRPLAGHVAVTNEPAPAPPHRNANGVNGIHEPAAGPGEGPVYQPGDAEPVAPDTVVLQAESPVEPLFAAGGTEPAVSLHTAEGAAAVSAVPDWAASLWGSPPAAAEPRPSEPEEAEHPAPAGFEWCISGASATTEAAAEAPIPPADPFMARAEPAAAEPAESNGAAMDSGTAETAIVPDVPIPEVPAGGLSSMDWDLGFREQAPAWSRPATPELAHTNGTATGALHLRITLGDRSFNWSLAECNAILGRRDPATGRVPDLDLWPDTAVSRRHARITYRTGRYYLTDLGSTNGTEVNGRELRQQAEQQLSPGDEILMGEKTRIQVTQAP